LLAEARAFFASRGILEVDCPCLTTGAPVDAHIDLLTVLEASGSGRYLHSSPEYGMKRLLAMGACDIYQLGHVFRAGEVGPLHNPEFTLAEWYRVGMAYDTFIEEALAFIRLFLGPLPARRLSYRDAFLQYIHLDPFTADIDALIACAAPLHPTKELAQGDRDTLLQLIMSFLIEPHLGQEALCVIDGYPASQAALAQVQGGVAERFEVYFRGIELANGYHELADAHEQRQRLHAANAHRLRLGKPSLPLDEYFLKALEHGLPDCCGCAAGFDRLLLLRQGASTLAEVLPFSWNAC
jgi:lysyl-tRNA synthetase class 2